jgi:hypothetical protein
VQARRLLRSCSPLCTPSTHLSSSPSYAIPKPLSHAQIPLLRAESDLRLGWRAPPLPSLLSDIVWLFSMHPNQLHLIAIIPSPLPVCPLVRSLQGCSKRSMPYDTTCSLARDNALARRVVAWKDIAARRNFQLFPRPVVVLLLVELLHSRCRARKAGRNPRAPSAAFWRTKQPAAGQAHAGAQGERASVRARTNSKLTWLSGPPTLSPWQTSPRAVERGYLYRSFITLPTLPGTNKFLFSLEKPLLLHIGVFKKNWGNRTLRKQRLNSRRQSSRCSLIASSRCSLMRHCRQIVSAC